MFGWFNPKLPLALSQAVTVDRCMSRVAQTFGLERLRAAEVIRPTPEFFPEPYAGTDESAHDFYEKVCRWVNLDAQRMALKLVDPDPDRSWVWGSAYVEGDPGLLLVSRACLADPMRVMAALTYGLSTMVLAETGIRLASSWQRMLAESLTIFLGLGIFAANACIQQKQGRDWRVFRWSIERHGALTEQQIGYGLALFAWLRDERRSAWAADLSADVREPFERSLQYLLKTGDNQFKPADEDVGLSQDQRLARRIDVLNAPSRGARLAAIWDIQNWGPQAAAALQPLEAVLARTDDVLQANAASALGSIGPAAEDAVPALADACVQEFDGELRRAAAGALGAIARGPDAAVPALLYLLKSQLVADRILAAWALGRFGEGAGPAVEALTERLEDMESRVAEEAAYALGSIGGLAAAALPALIRALRAGEGAVPAGAAYAVGCMGAAAISDAVPALRRALRHNVPMVVAEAAHALHRLGFADTNSAGAASLPDGMSRGAGAHRDDPRFRQA